MLTKWCISKDHAARLNSPAPMSRIKFVITTKKIVSAARARQHVRHRS